MELKNVDLNLLLVFNQLLVEKRVSKAAESLGLTQSGVSNALKRLRVLLGDELFVRTVRGMEPTPYALGLAEPIPERYAMACVEPFGLRHLRHPVPIPEININVFWHAKFNQEPANKWLRTLICETFAGGGDAPS